MGTFPATFRILPLLYSTDSSSICETRLTRISIKEIARLTRLEDSEIGPKSHPVAVVIALKCIYFMVWSTTIYRGYQSNIYGHHKPQFKTL